MTSANLAGENVIFVVDPCAADYESLAVAAADREIEFHILTSGEEAMRQSIPTGAQGWMFINLQLPDMPGLELFEGLRPRLANGHVFMVDDRYDAARELAVLSEGKPHYVCRPLNASWLDEAFRETVEREV